MYLVSHRPSHYQQELAHTTGIICHNILGFAANPCCWLATQQETKTTTEATVFFLFAAAPIDRILLGRSWLEVHRLTCHLHHCASNGINIKQPKFEDDLCRIHQEVEFNTHSALLRATGVFLYTTRWQATNQTDGTSQEVHFLHENEQRH